jgi:hypothetical protein
MTVLAGIAALAMATCVGYHLGRRAGRTPSTWTQRTSRIALGRQAIGLLVLLTVRRIRRRYRAKYPLAVAVHRRELRVIAPLELLRGSVARTRLY